jgi:hypothetical protein
MENNQKVTTPIREKFIGTWHLVNWEVQTADNQLYTSPYAGMVKVVIIYTKEGRMTALLMQENRPNFQHPNMWKGTDEEMRAAFKGYTSYSGGFEIRGKTVVHLVDMCLFPNWIGTELVRNYEFKKEAQLLELSTPLVATKNGVEVKQVLLWERQ